jgi:hypothetical protein
LDEKIIQWHSGYGDDMGVFGSILKLFSWGGVFIICVVGHASPLCCYCGQVCQKYYVKISFNGDKFYGCMRGADDFERNSNLRQLLPKKAGKISQVGLGSSKHMCSECGSSISDGYVKICLPGGKQYFCWSDHCQEILSEKIVESIAGGIFLRRMPEPL